MPPLAPIGEVLREGELLALGEKYDLVKKSGSSYSFGDTSLGRGYDASRTFLHEHKDVAKELLKQIKAKFDE
jgi:recombination protein RecA